MSPRQHDTAALLAGLSDELRQLVLSLPLTPDEQRLMTASLAKPPQARSDAWSTIVRARCYALERLRDEPDAEPCP